ncbi:hypothetical protein GYMLUDRAFT_155496 [Collybiopsis luxurians FD-317 M1]|nr:hypothetical protein GYMLUDRAFT_155496 [Collybiopsis luxurians FD-317 M1]
MTDSTLLRPQSIVESFLSDEIFDNDDYDYFDDNTNERPPIPTVLPTSSSIESTPLPGLAMAVLSIAMLGEFLSASVSPPFLLFMVKGFGSFTSDAEVSLWTGLLVSSFFLTQFLTSLLWASIAEKYGRKLVLVVSLLGAAVTCSSFGAATSLWPAIGIRLLQGVFAGAIGVVRGSVSWVTDATNEGRAYAILGFCWGVGGIVGSVIGGTFERPAVKWPSVFTKIHLFVQYPYLLPCAIAGSILLIGACLACFLDSDATVPESYEKIEVGQVDETTPILGYTPPQYSAGSVRFPDPNAPELGIVGVPLGGRTQTMSSISTGRRGVPMRRTTTIESAGSGRRGRGRGVSMHRIGTTESAATGRRGVSMYRTTTVDSTTTGFRRPRPFFARDVSLARKFLLANENAVSSMADLWVAAAMNVDDGFDLDDYYDDEDEEGVADKMDSVDGENAVGDDSVVPEAFISSDFAAGPSDSTSVIPSPLPRRVAQPLRPTSWARPGVNLLASQSPSIINSPQRSNSGAYRPTSTIFSNSGIQAPVEADNLAPIPESNVATHHPVEEKSMSLASQLPMLVIVQYGMLALHSTTHDQVFLSYLVTSYGAGGLNLNAGHFAQLIGLMTLAQIFYQFYLYPHLGPPRGPASHLTMFRIGSILFVLSYTMVVFFREPLAGPKSHSSLPLMSALAFSMAVRFCASTFSYTAISVLLNYLTPPESVGYANGIAQSIVSLARCFGPIVGGWMWSASTEGNPSGYPWGFVACACFTVFALLHSFKIQ